MCSRKLVQSNPQEISTRAFVTRRFLEKHSPLKVQFVFTSRRCVTAEERGDRVYTKRWKVDFRNTLWCLLLKWMKPSIVRRWSKTVIFWWSTLLTCSFCKSPIDLDYSKAEPYQRICPLGAPMNVLLAVGCILHVLWYFSCICSPFHVFFLSLFGLVCFTEDFTTLLQLMSF